MPFDSPAFANDPGLLQSVVRDRGLPPEGEHGWMAEASLYRLGFNAKQVQSLVLRNVFAARLHNPEHGMGCLFLRTYTNTQEEMANLIVVLPAARRLYDHEELEQLLLDPVRRQEVLEALAGYTRLGGDLTDGEIVRVVEGWGRK